MTSTMPPRVSPSFCASSTSATIAAVVDSPNARTGLASIRSRSCGPGSSSSAASTAPSATTCDTMSTSSACFRNALAAAGADTADDLELVGLELHPRAAAVAEATAGQLGSQLLGGDLDAGDHAFQYGHQRGTVGLPSGDPAQHAPNPLTPPHRRPHRSARPPTPRPAST